MYTNKEYLFHEIKNYHKRHDPDVIQERCKLIEANDIIAEKIHDLSGTGLIHGCCVQP